MFKETKRRSLKLRKDARLRDLSGLRELSNDELEQVQGGLCLCLLCLGPTMPAPKPEPEEDSTPGCDGDGEYY